MSTPRPASGSRPPGWQQEHARRYLESGGKEGHIWEGVPRARTASKAERPALWKKMAGIWPPYDEYQARTTREIPVVILERGGGGPG